MELGGAGDLAGEGPADPDALLMTRVQAGDRAAFAALVRRHEDALVGYLCRLCGDRQRAEDLAQETFLRLYLHRERYQEAGKLQAYLYRIATNLLRSAARRRARRRLLWLGFTPAEAADPPGVDPDQHLLLREEQRLVARALLQVPLKFRAPLLLHVVQGLSYPEVAEALECLENTVKSRISRGRKLLRREVQRMHDGGRR